MADEKGGLPAGPFFCFFCYQLYLVSSCQEFNGEHHGVIKLFLSLTARVISINLYQSVCLRPIY